MWFTYMHTSLTITSKNSHVLWMSVCNWSSAHLYTIMLCHSFNNFTGCLSTNVLSLKSFWSPLKYSRAQLLKISAIKFLFNCHPVMIYGEITRDFFWAPQSVSRKLPQGNWSFMAAAPQLWKIEVSSHENSVFQENNFKLHLSMNTYDPQHTQKYGHLAK